MSSADPERMETEEDKKEEEEEGGLPEEVLQVKDKIRACSVAIFLARCSWQVFRALPDPWSVVFL